MLKGNKAKPLRKSRRGRKPKRCFRPIPGDWVQMDICKIAPGKYRTSLSTTAHVTVYWLLFLRRTAANTLEFIDQVIEKIPIPVQRFQTDQGLVFFRSKSKNAS